MPTKYVVDISERRGIETLTYGNLVEALADFQSKCKQYNVDPNQTPVIFKTPDGKTFGMDNIGYATLGDGQKLIIVILS